MMKGLVLTTIFLLGVVTAAVSGLDEKVDARQEPVWPGPPEKARIAWVENWDNTTLLKKSKGFFGRIGDFLFGEKSLQFRAPYAISVAESPFFAITDSESRCVWIVDRSTSDVRQVTGGRSATLAAPVGVTFGSGNRLFVVDSELKKIFVFSTDGKFREFFAESVEWGRPVGIAYDATNDHFWISDAGMHQLVRLDESGRQIGTVGTRGDGPGQFNFPGQLAVGPQNRLYVVDSLNFRIQIFSPRGEYLASFGIAGNRPGAFARPRGIAVSRQGHVYVSDALSDVIQIFDRSGALLLDFGAHGNKPGQFAMPAGISIDGNDMIYVADHLNRRIQVFRYLGED
jgi:DNA-binding beta-propeller fold protein YncE